MRRNAKLWLPAGAICLVLVVWMMCPIMVLKEPTPAETEDEPATEVAEIDPNKPPEIRITHVFEIEDDFTRMKGLVVNADYRKYEVYARVCFQLPQLPSNGSIVEGLSLNDPYGTFISEEWPIHVHSTSFRYIDTQRPHLQIGPDGKWEIDIPHSAGYTVHFFHAYLLPETKIDH